MEQVDHPPACCLGSSSLKPCIQLSQLEAHIMSAVLICLPSAFLSLLFITPLFFLLLETSIPYACRNWLMTPLYPSLMSLWYLHKNIFESISVKKEVSLKCGTKPCSLIDFSITTRISPHHSRDLSLTYTVLPPGAPSRFCQLCMAFLSLVQIVNCQLRIQTWLAYFVSLCVVLLTVRIRSENLSAYNTCAQGSALVTDLLLGPVHSIQSP